MALVARKIETVAPLQAAIQAEGRKATAYAADASDEAQVGSRWAPARKPLYLPFGCQVATWRCSDDSFCPKQVPLDLLNAT